MLISQYSPVNPERQEQSDAIQKGAEENEMQNNKQQVHQRKKTRKMATGLISNRRTELQADVVKSASELRRNKGLDKNERE
jgi:hypothetical protein